MPETTGRDVIVGRGIARHGVLPVTTAARSIGKFLSIALVVALVSGAVTGVIFWQRTIGGTTTIADPGGSPVNLAEIEGGANILIVGSDDRTGQGEEFGEGEEDAAGVLNDVTMLVHVSEDHSRISVVSIPRDTIIDTPACSDDAGQPVEERYGVAFNSILQEGGLNCVRSTVEAMSGLQIQYLGMVKFRGVIALSNAIGGIRVCVANEVSDDQLGLYLQQGEHVLQGEDALKFLRTREGLDGQSDLSRISNQQLFLSATLQQVKSADTLTSPAKIYGIATAITQNMVLSESLQNPDTLVALARVLANVPLESITFVTLPVVDAEIAGKVAPMYPDVDDMWQRVRSDLPLTLESAEAPTEEPEGTGDTGETTVPDPVADGTDGSAPPTTGDPSLIGQGADQQTCANADE